MEFLIDHFNYWVYIILMMIGLHAMISKNNLIKKLIGMSIFQTAIMLFYVSIGVKEEATIPILEKAGKKDGAHGDDHAVAQAADHAGDAVAHGADHAGETAQAAAGHTSEQADAIVEAASQLIDTAAQNGVEVAHYANPLPHVLILTAIVVGVATLGVGLAVVQKVHQRYGSIEENEILSRVKM